MKRKLFLTWLVLLLAFIVLVFSTDGVFARNGGWDTWRTALHNHAIEVDPHTHLGAFIRYTGNPILAPEGAETYTTFGSVLKVGSTYHMYYHYLVSSVSVIGHATSTDGKTWTKDTANNPVLEKGASGWDRTDVGVPMVWKEGTTWYMMYRGKPANSGGDAVGLATSTDGVSWTKSGSNPVIEDSQGAEVWGVIKVGSTYYAYFEGTGGTGREIGVATSTNLTSWTKDANNPILTTGRFCPFAFKHENFYYLIVPHYTYDDAHVEFELYRDSSPTFYPATREYLGVILNTSSSDWDNNTLDTPFILTDDINRNSLDLTGGDVWLYYAGRGDTVWQEGLLISSRTRGLWQQESVVTGHGYGTFHVIKTENIIASGSPTASVIDFSNITLDYTGANGPALLRAGTYDSPLSNSDEDQSGMIRFYSTTSANGSSYDRGVFVCQKTTGTKAVFPIAGLAEIKAQTGAGPTKAMAGQFITMLQDSTSKLAALGSSTDGMYGIWAKVGAVEGAITTSGSRVAAIWLDNQLNGSGISSGMEEYAAFITTGGSKPDAVFGFETTSSGWSQLLYFDETAYDQEPVSSNHLKVLLNTTQYYIPLSSTTDGFTGSYADATNLLLHRETGDADETVMFINHDISGTMSTSRTIHGFFIDIDVSSVGYSADPVINTKIYGNKINININEGGNAYQVYGLISDVIVDAATTLDNYRMAGTVNQFTHLGSGMVTKGYGFFGQVVMGDVTNTGSMTEAFANANYVFCKGGTITTAYGNYSYVKQYASGGGTGVITTAYLYYGEYVGTIGTAWGIYITGATQSYLSGKLLLAGNLLINGAVEAGNLAGGMAMLNGTAASSTVTNSFQLYSADIVAGNAAPHFYTEAGNLIKLYTYAEITDELTTITHDAPGAPDYAIATPVQNTGFGFSTSDEMNSTLAVIANLQARVNELETALATIGLLADAD